MNSPVNILQSEIIDTYLSTKFSTEQATHNDRRILNLWTVMHRDWDRVNLDHPCTFEGLAMDPVQKEVIIKDLDHFLQREFYKRVGRPWKRGYLLYGPPGTGKSSVVAAMANYLRFDIYDLLLGMIDDDAMLRDLMRKIKNKSILVIDDIKCSIGLPSTSLIGSEEDEEGDVRSSIQTKEMSLLLNIVDGIWSNYGDEIIIIFTTNHKDGLDPALLWPGRMDVHVNMSYLSMPVFKILAANYLLIEDHPLFGEIEKLLQQGVQVSPAQVAEELMRSEEAASDIALQRVIAFLKGKKNDPTHEQDAV